MVGIGGHAADAKEDQRLEAANVLVGVPELMKIVVAGAPAGLAAAGAALRQGIPFTVHPIHQFIERRLVKVDIGDGGKEPFDHQPPGGGRGLCAAVCGAGKADQGAGQPILKIGHVGRLSAHAGLAGAASASGGLFTLKAKHLLIHRFLPKVY